MAVIRRGLYPALSLLLGVASVVLGHGNHRHTHDALPSGHSGDTVFQDASLVTDTEHIKEHLKEKINENDINEMSSDELQFQFFVAHDLNGDAFLDGLEVFKSLEHVVGHMNVKQPSSPEEGTKQLMSLTDEVLEEQDENDDGYIDYKEFRQGSG